MGTNIDQFIFCVEDYIFNVDWECWNKTSFNMKLENSWNMKEKCFRYNLNITTSRILEGKHGFYAQLNIDRAHNKRSPEDIKSLNQPFSSDSFNFTKVNKEEIMFSFSMQQCAPENECENFFLINVSPLEQYHCLLIPSLYKCLNQTLTKEALHLAISSVLLSGTPELRVGFNSLCGYATVNHLHLHAYYLNKAMKLETIELKHLIGRCYVLENYPAKAFVFQLTCKEEFKETVSDIHRLTDFFCKEEVAHNLFVTRGLNFERSKCHKAASERDCIRIYVWARTSSYGAKMLDAFNPALCELFGHLVVKSSETYDELTEESVCDILHSITDKPYSAMKESVKELYLDKMNLCI